MTFHPQRLLRASVAEMEAYQPIEPFEVLSKRLDLPASEIIKLDANENPYGPVPAVAEALAEYPYYHIYPDPQQRELRAGLSSYTGVPAQNILPTHGADELLDVLCRLFLQPGDRIVNCPPTFGMYSFNADLVGAGVTNVARRVDHSVDTAAVETLFEQPESRPKLLFLTSPNNPSGTWLPDAELVRLLALPVLVILDEAYVEFAEEPSRSDWVLKHENLVVVRTFSKAAGMAGLRLGYGICPLWLMEQLWKFKQPYNVNVAAAVAGLASLHSIDAIRQTVGKLVSERIRLMQGLAGISYLEPSPSQANFVLCRVHGRSASLLKRELEERGILVRYYAKPGLENYIRISVGRPEQTDVLLHHLHLLEA